MSSTDEKQVDTTTAPAVDPGSRPATVAEVLVTRPALPLYKDWGALKLYAVLFPGVLLVSSTVGFEGSLMNGIQSLTTWNTFFHPSTTITGLINSTYWLGATLAYPFAQLIGDRYGRKSVIYVSAAVSIIGTVLQTASQNVATFVVARIFFGFCAILGGNSAAVLVAESVHPRDRKVVTSLYNSSYYIGAILAAWTTYGTGKNIDNGWAWRLPSLLQGILMLINIVFLPFVPESPRWLVAQGRHDDALSTLASAHGNGDANDALVQAEFHEIRESIELQSAVRSPWKTMWNGSANRKRLFLLFYIGLCLNLSGNGLVSYYLSKVLDAVGVTSEDEQTLINGILSIVSWVTCLVAAWASHYLGRRVQFLMSATTMFGSFIAVTVADATIIKDPANKGASYAVIFFVFLFMCGYNWAFNPLAYAYPAEILPYNLRLVGMSTVLFACTLAGYFNQWVNPVGLANITWRYYIVYVAWLFVEIVVIYFTFPETLGFALEEIAPLLEGDTFITKIRKPQDTKTAAIHFDSESD
ncbi:hypothetical protein SCUCBS95973_007019 [Sporothrix curviconia]|uniref:Major facilitator superfamily (MFS) profile domain-containing protein n=1 Tax=Sporothrix curviconia TaxID=1260050 RepID=A0ABP0CCG8_9PEZI